MPQVSNIEHRREEMLDGPSTPVLPVALMLESKNQVDAVLVFHVVDPNLDTGCYVDRHSESATFHGRIDEQCVNIHPHSRLFSAIYCLKRTLSCSIMSKGVS